MLNAVCSRLDPKLFEVLIASKKFFLPRQKKAYAASLEKCGTAQRE
jgi:hypothetical protein